MKSRRTRSGFTVVEVLVVILVLGLFGVCVWPAARRAREKREIKDTLAQAAQLRLAILEANGAGDTAAQARAVWPTGAAIRSSTEYFKAVFDTNRTRSVAPLHLLAAPGIPAWTGTLASLTESNVAWCVTRWNGLAGSNDVPFLYTRNLVASHGGDSLIDLDTLDPKAKPFGGRGAVVVTARGNVRLIQQRETNENLQAAVNPYRDSNGVLRAISVKRAEPAPQPPKGVGSISGKPLNAPPLYPKKQKEPAP
jgi:prepilin-type N-terminal cleavage/methylation domain-containing protein